LDLERLTRGSELAVLVSDGQASFAEPDPAAPPCPIVAVASAPGDTRRLERLARGRVVSLEGLAPAVAAARVLDEPAFLLEARGESLRDVLPTARPLDSARVSVCGHVASGQ